MCVCVCVQYAYVCVQYRCVCVCECVRMCVCLCVRDYGGTVMCANPVPCGHHFMLFSGWIINISEPCILVMFPGGVNGSDIDLKFLTPP